MQRILSALAVFLLVLGTPGNLLLATDYFVDAVNGSDSNNGLSPGTAWKTISYAVGCCGPNPTPADQPGDTVRVLPGTYDCANGENFPIPLPDGVTLFGDGPDLSIVDGSGFPCALQPRTTTAVIEARNISSTSFPTVVRDLRVVGVSSVQTACIAFDNLNGSLFVSDCRLSGARNGVANVFFGLQEDNLGGPLRGDLTVQGNEIEFCPDNGVILQTRAPSLGFTASIIDNDFLSCSAGVRIRGTKFAGGLAGSDTLLGMTDVLVNISSNDFSAFSSTGIGVTFEVSGNTSLMAEINVRSNRLQYGHVGIHLEAVVNGLANGNLTILPTVENNFVSSISGEGIVVSAQVSAEDLRGGENLGGLTLARAEGLIKWNTVTRCDTGMDLRANVDLAGCLEGGGALGGTASAFVDLDADFNCFTGNFGNGVEIFTRIESTCPGLGVVNVAEVGGAWVGNLIADNDSDGVNIRRETGSPCEVLPDFGGLELADGRNTIRGNFELDLLGTTTHYDIFNGVSETLYAEGNWWGTNNDCRISEHVANGYCVFFEPAVGPGGGPVDYEPFLVDPIPFTVEPESIPNAPGALVTLTAGEGGAFVQRTGSDRAPGGAKEIEITLGGVPVLDVMVDEGEEELALGPFPAGRRLTFRVPPGIFGGALVLLLRNPGAQQGMAAAMVPFVFPFDVSRCFIATAAYGDENAPEVQVLRRLRDECLAGNALGRQVLRAYYALSPSLAEVLAGSPVARTAVRATLAPVVGAARLWLEMPWLFGIAGAVLLLRALRKRG